MAERVLIDCDPGIDDALALILALKSPEITVEAITTVAGNAPVDVCTANVCRILDLVQPPRQPMIARGASKPIKRPLRTAPEVHGSDGLGGLDQFRHPDGSPRYPSAAVGIAPAAADRVILDTIAQHPDELTIITLGPLTNLARAIQTDCDLMGRVKRIVTMGGAVGVPGNSSPVAEFNIWVDPDAAQILLHAGLPVTLVPLNVTRQVQLSREAIESWFEPIGDALAQFILDSTAHAAAFGAEREGFAGITLHDPLAVAVAIDPSLVTTREVAIAVETTGALTAGMTVADLRPRPDSGVPNAEVAMAVEADRFLTFFVERLCQRSW
ncbi:MAG: nucleoside hydrolase [Candidatus Methylomirabilales bacterium]